MDRELRRLMGQRKGVPLRLLEAMRHSLLGGGKRLRPILALWVWDALQAHRGASGSAASRERVLLAGAGLEMIHTYSLIHDDLPAMDDDILRRGRPTCHVAFDEATAILAGDALQALGFQHLALAGQEQAAELVALVARCVGPAGMVGGQQEDLDAEDLDRPTARLIRSIHLKKTAALLAAACGVGALLGGASPTSVDRLFLAGQELGLAFQGADDLLDVTASTEQLGKSAGKDAAAGKATWVELEGLEAAARRTGRHGQKGLRLLREELPTGAATDRMLALGAFLWNRQQ